MAHVRLIYQRFLALRKQSYWKLLRMTKCSWNVSNYVTSKLVTGLFSDWPLDPSPLFSSYIISLAAKLLMGWDWFWQLTLLQLPIVLTYGIFFYCLTLSFKLTKQIRKCVNIIVAAVVLIFFLSEKKKRTELKEPDLMENTTPHLKSSPSPSFVFFRFAILGQSNRKRATVADPDLQIRGECGHPYPEVRGSPGLKGFFFPGPSGGRV